MAHTPFEKLAKKELLEAVELYIKVAGSCSPKITTFICHRTEQPHRGEGDIIMSASIYDIPVQKITGEDTSLAEFKGKVLLVVNVASKCGLTPQYEGLEKLYEQYTGPGPGGCRLSGQRLQEPGAGHRTTEIQTFCTANFGVKFPMFSKITVVGAEKHPLYAALIAAQPKAVSLGEIPFAREAEGLRNRHQSRAGDSVEL